MDSIMIGRQIRHFRRMKDLTQEQFADRVQLTVDALRQIERGACAASEDVLLRCCKTLGITLNELLENPDLEGQAQKMSWIL